MRGKLMFITGLAAGFVLGSRAGREKYEEISANAKLITQGAQSVRTIPVPLAKGSETPKTVRFYDADDEGQPNTNAADLRVDPPPSPGGVRMSGADPFSFTVEVRDGRHHALRNGWPVGAVTGYPSDFDARKALKQITRLNPS